MDKLQAIVVLKLHPKKLPKKHGETIKLTAHNFYIFLPDKHLVVRASDVPIYIELMEAKEELGHTKNVGEIRVHLGLSVSDSEAYSFERMRSKKIQKSRADLYVDIDEFAEALKSILEQKEAQSSE
ncbi:MAG: hypothetical protein HWN68_02245 [Desulfobacterales bacterium]|nr:hypothetical protein [Desulfobacterales bacterium]